MLKKDKGEENQQVAGAATTTTTRRRGAVLPSPKMAGSFRYSRPLTVFLRVRIARALSLYICRHLALRKKSSLFVRLTFSPESFAHFRYTEMPPKSSQ